MKQNEGAKKTDITENEPNPDVIEEPPSQELVYFNARIALRRKRYKDVVRLWLLHNTLESQGEKPVHEGDFRSAVWAALAGAGLCHDGLRDDDDGEGVGLWPLALHNWLTRSSSRQPAPSQPRAFTSFSTGFQQRHFSVHDILSAEELKGARFFRKDCRRVYLALAQFPTFYWRQLDDRLSRGILMRDLVEKARRTLEHKRVRGQVVLETRLFDLDLALVKLAKGKARRETGILAQLARASGVSESAMTLVRDRRLAAVRASQYADLLRRCLKWNELSWMSLSLNRRLALYDASRKNHMNDEVHAEKLQAALLLNIDALIEKQDGKALNLWLGFAVPTKEIELRSGQSELLSSLVLGVRGKRLLSLGPDTGFRERATVALRRGHHYLAQGKDLDAMRSFSLALKRSVESSRSEEVHSLTKRWFSYVLAQHDVNEEVLALLSEFVSPIERNELLEVLLWRAAFHADSASYERIASGIKKGGALDVRVRHLRYLSKGDPGAMYRSLRSELRKRPGAIYSFVNRGASELAAEDLDVRLKNRATLELGLNLLKDIARGTNRGLVRRITKLQMRMQSLLDGLQLYDDSATGRARSAVPGAEAYAGSVRLAPADPMPWPFKVPRTQVPSPFAPIHLTPIEWLDDAGERIYGWHIHE